MNELSFKFIVQITLNKHQKIEISNINFDIEKRNLDYKLKTTRIQFYVEETFFNFEILSILIA